MECKTAECSLPASQEGSDSGVEVGDPPNGPAADNSKVCHPDSGGDEQMPSCDSSVISCCSNYDDAYSLLVRRNSTLLEDYKLGGHQVDGTSENGSESSSVGGRRGTSAKVVQKVRRCASSVARTKSNNNNSGATTTTLTRNASAARLKSLDRLQCKTPSKAPPATNKAATPSTLDVSRKDTNRALSSSRTPVSTPSDDGRWPFVSSSSSSKPAPLMTRSLRVAANDDKYATLPRARKDKSETLKKSKSREDVQTPRTTTTTNKEPTAKNWMKLPYMKRKQKVRIYHETETQTALFMDDIVKLLNGVEVEHVQAVKNNRVVHRNNKGVQVEIRMDNVEKLRSQLKFYKEKCDVLTDDNRKQATKIEALETDLRKESVEKAGLNEELRINSQRVFAILGENNIIDEEQVSTNSLTVLGARYHSLTQVVIQQEQEISKLNAQCRQMQINFENSQVIQLALTQRCNDLQTDSVEMEEFIQAEKCTLSDALKEAESEIERLTVTLERQSQQIRNNQEQSQYYCRLAEKRWRENLTMGAKLGAIEANSKELLVQHGSSVSGAAVAIASVIHRLQALIGELVRSCDMSEQDLEDIVFHNEAYPNSSNASSPDSVHTSLTTDLHHSTNRSKSSFVSAVIAAIRNATLGVKTDSKDSIYVPDESASNEMLDSETEPCLMMEPVLENVTIPDGHSRNMVSACNSSPLSSESRLKTSHIWMEASSRSTDGYPTLIDQVIQVDNLVTKLLKVIRIVHVGHEDCLAAMTRQRDEYSLKQSKQQETNRAVAVQLKNWEKLGGHLKAQIVDVTQQLREKNRDHDRVQNELRAEREKNVSQYRTDILCDSCATLVRRVQNSNENNLVQNASLQGGGGEADVIPSDKYAPSALLRPKCQSFSPSAEMVRPELRCEQFQSSAETIKKQYDAIDHVLDVLHSNRTVIEQCDQLATLLKFLENANFECATRMPCVSTGNPSRATVTGSRDTTV